MAHTRSRGRVVTALLGIILLHAGVAPGTDDQDPPFRWAAAHAEAGCCWALAVGIDDYESEDIHDLEFAVADVREVAGALVGTLGLPPDNVFVMTSDARAASIDRPTNVNVIKRLDFLAGSINPDDTFIFYFSGHGYQREGDRHFLGTVNADPTTVETLQMTTLPLELLREKMAKIRARQVVIIVDACRNDPEKGRGAGDNRLSDSMAKDLLVVANAAGAGLAGNAVLFACSSGERAYDWSERRHGAFSFYLLDGLSGKAAEPGGDITMASLGDHVQRNVVTWARQRGKQQTPDLHQQGAARIVLGRVAPGSGVVLSLTGEEGHLPVPGQAPQLTPPLVPPPVSVGAGQTWTNPEDGMEFVFVPAGPFTIGSDDREENEKPAHSVRLLGYRISKYEVTLGQFRQFVRSSGYQPAGAWEQSGTDDRLPVTGVTWGDAAAYCRWAGGRLPTEPEWEKAARGTDGREFVWGSAWPPPRGAGNFADSAARTSNPAVPAIGGYDDGFALTAPVGSFPGGASPYGCLDMAGNVWEWCSSTYNPYPYNADDEREDPSGIRVCVIRGGGFRNGEPRYLAAPTRGGLDRRQSSVSIGFRYVMGVE
ncbi:MAG: SUMF1/EgtB/PvdO family nonheme iron enzyme [Armatimonadetes bacterium]|nr:SUMF1/EgtB/PvdO family nonheme iron enzyme [Armatimonadota bacterium]